MGSGGIAPPLLTSALVAPVALALGKNSQFPLDRRLGGPRTNLEDVEKILALARTRGRYPGSSPSMSHGKYTEDLVHIGSQPVNTGTIK
jgi:hypothetical protein